MNGKPERKDFDVSLLESSMGIQMIPTTDEVWKVMEKSRSFLNHPERGALFGFFYRTLGEFYAAEGDYIGLGDEMWKLMEADLPKKYWHPKGAWATMNGYFTKIKLQALEGGMVKRATPEELEAKMKFVAECASVVASQKKIEPPRYFRRGVRVPG